MSFVYFFTVQKKLHTYVHNIGVLLKSSSSRFQLKHAIGGYRLHRSDRNNLLAFR